MRLENHPFSMLYGRRTMEVICDLGFQDQNVKHIDSTLTQFISKNNLEYQVAATYVLRVLPGNLNHMS